MERKEAEAIVRVRDSGIGVAPDVQPHVFDLFIQAGPSSRLADAGLGIGLALVRSLVERHGGRVTAVSAGPGHGSGSGKPAAHSAPEGHTFADSLGHVG